MDVSPKVSVIVPIYGVEKYIERCAESLFRQTLDSIEFIFIDDCTPDNSMALLEAVIDKNRHRFARMRWQVRTEKMSSNSGLPTVRRHGVMLATGNFVVHCDSDDWIEPNMYRLMYEKAIDEEADAVVCDFNLTDGERVLKTICGCSFTDKDLFIEQILYQRNPWTIWNKMFKRTSCYKTDIIYPKGNMGEDFVLTTQLLLNSSKVAYVALPLYNYFYNTSSITRVRTEERKMNNFHINKANADIVFEILAAKSLEKRYSQAMVSSKWYVKKLLWDTNFNVAKRNLWKDTYKEINKQIITSCHISVKEKVKFILTYLFLFPKQGGSRRD